MQMIYNFLNINTDTWIWSW